eukprot:COSAG05_NODE_13_length_36464_cov_294.169449_6_plen_142_part_00
MVAVAAETKLLLSGHVWYCQNCPMDGATARGWSKKMNVLILSFCRRRLNPAPRIVTLVKLHHTFTYRAPSRASVIAGPVFYALVCLVILFVLCRFRYYLRPMREFSFELSEPFLHLRNTTSFLLLCRRHSYTSRTPVLSSG